MGHRAPARRVGGRSRLRTTSLRFEWCVRNGSETSQTVLAAGREKYHRAKGKFVPRTDLTRSPGGRRRRIQVVYQGGYQSALYIAIGTRKVLPLRHIDRTFGGVGGLYYGAREASFEAKASEDSLACIGDRRGVFVAGRQCSRGNWRSGNRYPVVGHCSASRNHSWGRGNL
jgi:hypothetical protein